MVGVRGFEPPNLCVPNAALYPTELHPDKRFLVIQFLLSIINVSVPNAALYPR